jgi:8-oxo-dGTP pyrophosphatase MutT (NUDIX family)
MKQSNDAQGVIVRQSEDGKNFFLVIKRFDKDKKQDHFRLVKGGLEEGETSEQAVIREIGEEVGIHTISETNFLCHYGYTGGEVRHEVDVYIVRVPFDEQHLAIDSENEGGFTIKSAVWMDANEAMQSLTFEDEKKLIVLVKEKLN